MHCWHNYANNLLPHIVEGTQYSTLYQSEHHSTMLYNYIIVSQYTFLPYLHQTHPWEVDQSPELEPWATLGGKKRHTYR